MALSKITKRHRFSGEIIHIAVWLHRRFKLRHSDAEDLQAPGASLPVIRTMRSSILCGEPLAKTVKRFLYSCRRGEMETSRRTFLDVDRIDVEESLRM
jgi:hypothetical protein